MYKIKCISCELCVIFCVCVRARANDMQWLCIADNEVLHEFTDWLERVDSYEPGPTYRYLSVCVSLFMLCFLGFSTLGVISIFQLVFWSVLNRMPSTFCTLPVVCRIKTEELKWCFSCLVGNQDYNNVILLVSRSCVKLFYLKRVMHFSRNIILFKHFIKKFYVFTTTITFFFCYVR